MAKISVIAKLTTKPGARPQVLEGFEAFVAETVAAEEGTEIYSLHLDPNDETVLWVVELYADQAALDAHMTSAGFMALLGAVGDHMGAAPEMHILSPTAAKGLAL